MIADFTSYFLPLRLMKKKKMIEILEAQTKD